MCIIKNKCQVIMECAICFKDESEGVLPLMCPKDTFSNHKCTHKFCAGCWFSHAYDVKKEYTCPVCREDVKEWLLKKGFLVSCKLSKNLCVCGGCNCDCVYEKVLTQVGYIFVSLLEERVPLPPFEAIAEISGRMVKKGEDEIELDKCVTCFDAFTDDNPAFCPEKKMKDKFPDKIVCKHKRCYSCMSKMRVAKRCHQTCEYCIKDMGLWLEHLFL